MSCALYRKYRPQSFGALVGQEYLVDILRNAGRQEKFAHAYILYGPRGTGKTTTARLLAKLANCLSRETVHTHGEPCNACRVCAEINEGRAMDVIEIDAASNRGIDEIRNVSESIRLSPSSYARKVFIIDEAHMLTIFAFNALLKTLEEPPDHAMLILATTEYEKIPATIISRAQRFHFRKLSMAEIIKKLKSIISAEKLTVSDEALGCIAAAAEGGLRDAESLLDQIISFTGAVDAKMVEDIMGKVGGRRVREFADYVVTRDISGALRALAGLQGDGANIVDLSKELIIYFRRALALRLDPTLENIFHHEVTEDELRALQAHSAALDPDKTIILLKSLIRAYSEMRYSPFPHVPFEVALIENLKK